jgi:iron-sulfur cluster repair protein YtfE (RIC family)
MLVTLGQKRSDPDLRGLLLDCHTKIRSFARLAVELSTRDDLADSELRDGCARCERYFTEALPLHVADEDESLRPRMRACSTAAAAALASMSAQHAEHRALLSALLVALGAMRERGSTAETRAALAAVAPRVEREFEAHLALEEAVIFPEIATALSPEQRADVLRELRARRAPT